MIRALICIASAAAMAGAALAAPTLAVDGPIGDGAVLQRDRTLVLSGDAPAGATVSVFVGAHAVDAVAAPDGRWSAAIPPMPAGGPFPLKIEAGRQRLRFMDVHFGDVWLCSGQSNMEYPVYRALNPDAEIAGPHDRNFRLLTIPQAAAMTPVKKLPAEAAWKAATPNVVRDFSAVCFFTARDLYADGNVPVGLIDASWGGSQIEAWLPANSLEETKGFESALAQLELFRSDRLAAMQAYGASWESWHRAAFADVAPWTGDGAGLKWRPVPAEMGDWKHYGDPEASEHFGRAWYSKRFVLTAEELAQAQSVALGEIDEVDAVWINGRFLASTFGWGLARRYEVPPGYLREGENLIVVNVLNTYGPGGMLGPAKDMALEFGGGLRAPLAGGWRYAIAPAASEAAPQLPWGSVSGLTTIHNGMIAPLGNFAMTGAIWYQGESNTDHPATYEALLKALIASWRAAFGEELAAVVIQLSSYGAMPSKAGPSGWSQIREAARRVAVADPRTGMVVSIDAGDRLDIHPPNKQVVSARAAAVARALLGRGGGFIDGVAPVSARRRGRKAILTMPTTNLKVIGARAPIAFELCDLEEVCAWAKASLVVADIVLEADGVAAPASARYCQGDAPICNLFTTGDLPVAPFIVDVR